MSTIQQELIIVNFNVFIRSIMSLANEIRKNLSDLIYREKIDDSGYLCYYKNLASENPITYLCDVGCCPDGCCSSQKIKITASYDLAVILLFIFVFAIISSAIAMFIIYCVYHSKKNDNGYEFSGSFVEDSTMGSQAHGLPTHSIVRRYLPQISCMKMY
ncbi:unnamed protein product [Thelazia callipaeda]|uniref:CX domain-containing protein n=1 Tax=Thelazia callipaeda TaxID=103827 RepID=A0A0N5D7A3_THECL|nr:unnamed protein product [Thelazia callipaeda]